MKHLVNTFLQACPILGLPSRCLVPRGVIWLALTSVVFAQKNELPVVESRGYSSSISAKSRYFIIPQISGPGPFTYQWYKDGAALESWTGDYFGNREVEHCDAGIYTVDVTNAAGSETGGPWTLNVLPAQPPREYSNVYPAAITYVAPGETLRMGGFLIFDHAPFHIQWYKDGQPLVGQNDDELDLPYAPDVAGSYVMVMTNTAGSTSTFAREVAIGPSNVTPLGGWSNRLTVNGVVHFMFENPARIERFDLATGVFLSPITMEKPASRFTYHDGSFYYAAVGNLRRMRIDGSGDESLANVASGLSDVLALNGRIYLKGLSAGVDMRHYDIATGALTYLLGWGYFSLDGAVVNQAGELFGSSSARLTKMTFRADGVIDRVFPRFVSESVPFGLLTWLIHSESKVVTSGGSVFSVVDPHYLGSLGQMADLAEANDGSLLVLRGESIELFDATLTTLGQMTLATPAHAIVSSGSRHYVFWQPDGAGSNLTATEIFLTSFAEPEPDAALDPTSLGLHSDDIIQDKRGNLYLHSRVHQSLWIWSPDESRFVASIRLQSGAGTLAYSRAWDRLLISYGDGRINQIQLGGSGFREIPFVHLPYRVITAIAVGERLLVTESEGSWGNYYLLDRNGALLDSTLKSSRPISAVWDSVRNRVLWVDGYSSPAIAHIEINPMGTFGEEGVSSEVSVNLALAPLRLSPDSNRLIVGNGVVIDADSLAPVGNVTSTLESSAWVGTKLYTAQTEFGGVRLTRWDGSTYVKEASVVLPGNRPQIFKTAQDQIAVVTDAPSRVLFSLFDQDLSLINRVNHQGESLVDSNRRLSNLSTRVNLAAENDESLVVGFVIAGADPLRVLIRAVGPTLGGFGVSQPLENPNITLFDADQTQIATNEFWDNHASVLRGAFIEFGAFPLEANSRDAALLVTLDPGVYTARVSRPATTGGTVLLELYDTSGGASSSSLANLSARMRTGSGDQVLTAGFVLTGDVDRTVLLRAVGPSLGRFGVSSVLQNPLLTIRQGSQVRAQNDDWSGAAAISDAANQVGAFPLDSTTSRDSAMLSVLPPGAYTVQVTGSEEGASGTALIEVYEIDY